VRAHAAARAGAPGEEGIFHRFGGVEPAAWVEAQRVRVKGRIAVEDVGLRADDRAWGEVVAAQAAGTAGRDGVRETLRDGVGRRRASSMTLSR
jgi:methylaspartate ammonia-lyase